METTEKVVEAYVRYVKGWATIPNIKCPGQYEIDLLAINPKSGERYHIESSVSISGGFSKLTAKPYDPEQMKVRVQQAAQRRTLGYFTDRKFSAPGILHMLAKYGFETGNYQKVIVSWDWDPVVEPMAMDQGIKLWRFADILGEIVDTFKDEKSYYMDDTLRTLQLFAKAMKEG